MKVRIVQATQDRMGEVAKVFKRSFRAVYPNFPELHSEEEDLAYFTDVVFPKNSVYLAEEAETGAVIGFIAFSSDFIDHLYLAPEAQNQGIGSKLLSLAKKNAERLQLWTFQQNAGARGFYKKHGFIEIRQTDGSSTEEKQPDVLLEWKNS